MILETPTLETERLILKKGLPEDFIKVYEYDFTKLRDICGEFKLVISRKDRKCIRLDNIPKRNKRTNSKYNSR